MLQSLSKLLAGIQLPVAHNPLELLFAGAPVDPLQRSANSAVKQDDLADSGCFGDEPVWEVWPNGRPFRIEVQSAPLIVPPPRDINGEKKFTIKRPKGPRDYVVKPQDTLSSIAFLFDTTTSNLAHINKLLSHTLLPGQKLVIPDPDSCFTSNGSSLSASSGSTGNVEQSGTEEDDICGSASQLRPCSTCLESSFWDEEETMSRKFIKIGCKYITDGQGAVAGVLLVTPNSIMFDPYKSDPLVLERGLHAFGLICPLQEIVSAAVYRDISRMQIHDALPSPAELGDFPPEYEFSLFSRFEQQKAASRANDILTNTACAELIAREDEASPATDSSGECNRQHSVDVNGTKPEKRESDQVDNEDLSHGNGISEDRGPVAKNHCCEAAEIDASPDQATKDGADNCRVQCNMAMPRNDDGHATTMVRCTDHNPITDTRHDAQQSMDVPHFEEELSGTETIFQNRELALHNAYPQSREDKIESNATEQETNLLESIGSEMPLGVSATVWYVNASEDGNNTVEERRRNSRVKGDCVRSEAILIPTANDALVASDERHLVNFASGFFVRASADDSQENFTVQDINTLEDSLRSVSSPSEPDRETESLTETHPVLKALAQPIEALLPYKQKPHLTSPMFLCMRVGRPMRNTFATSANGEHSSLQQHYSHQSQPEYWFALPQDKVEQLYWFFVRWTPEACGKKDILPVEPGFVVVERNESNDLDVIDNFYSDSFSMDWEIVTMAEARRRQSLLSLNEELEFLQPKVMEDSSILSSGQLALIARHLPPRTIGHAWHLAYSPERHGSSLSTLYRNLSELEGPGVLIVRDINNEVFGAFVSHPFHFSDHFYGTGDTFLFTFTPEFQVYLWTGENTFYILGSKDAIAVGGGGGVFGLWLDSDLYHGASNRCITFNNDPLPGHKDFLVLELEFWNIQ
uniref:nuclear receptor coactivator 7-like isoform X2 n=1 Tax=Myxine glutinosa TaxID=7769 RepID=UPI00358E3C66